MCELELLALVILPSLDEVLCDGVGGGAEKSLSGVVLLQLSFMCRFQFLQVECPL